MFVQRIVPMLIAIPIMAAAVTATAAVDPRRHRDQDQTRQALVKKRSGYIKDNRYRHNRYYPKQGYVRKQLPDRYRIYQHARRRYYFSGGTWYIHHGANYVVVRPPIGLRINILPPYYTTIWYHDIPYYYAADVYYRWYPGENVYVVSEPPPEKEVEQIGDTDPLFIYPKKNQSEEKQAADRYQCHRWALKQTGFDPTTPGGGVAANQYVAKRTGYYRAMKACLEGLAYSVK